MSSGEVPKLIRDGKVAILLTGEHGAGWYSWNGDEEMLYDPIIVVMVEKNTDVETITSYCTYKYPDAYLGGVDALKVRWIPEGEEFQIHEYDGMESIRLRKRERWLKA